jgi:hypothetical protein
MSRITKTVLRNAAERVASGDEWFMCWAIKRELGLPVYDPFPELEELMVEHGVLGGNLSAMGDLGDGYGELGYGTDAERRAVRVLFLLFLAESL